MFVDERSDGVAEWALLGRHNMANALAAIAAAAHAGVAPAAAVAALAQFRNVRRRLEVCGTVDGVTVYDDFAHHPTAIATTLEGLRGRVGQARIVALLEPRSNTMRMGVHKDTLGPALNGADAVLMYQPPNLGWDLAPVLEALGGKGGAEHSIDALVQRAVESARPGDHLLVMSNGAFGGIHERLLAALRARAAGHAQAVPVAGA